MSKKSDDARHKERKRTQGAAAKLYRNMTPEQQRAYREVASEEDQKVVDRALEENPE